MRQLQASLVAVLLLMVASCSWGNDEAPSTADLKKQIKDELREELRGELRAELLAELSKMAPRTAPAGRPPASRQPGVVPAARRMAAVDPAPRDLPPPIAPRGEQPTEPIPGDDDGGIDERADERPTDPVDPVDPAAPVDPEPTDPPADPPGDGDPTPSVSGLELIQLVLAERINRDERIPEGPGVSFDAALGKVYAFAVIKNPNERTQVQFQWVRDGKVMHTIPLKVGSSKRGWRTWASARVSRRTSGRWEIRVLDDTGALLGKRAFDVR